MTGVQNDCISSGGTFRLCQGGAQTLHSIDSVDSAPAATQGQEKGGRQTDDGQQGFHASTIGNYRAKIIFFTSSKNIMPDSQGCKLL
jgi:hypothetical protein